MTPIVDQPAPIATGRRPVWDLVIEHVEGRRATLPKIVDRVIGDMRDRDAVGRERYGTPLTAGNGRDHLVDAYQEALDLAAYLMAELDEHGVAIDGSIDAPAPDGLRLLHVQALLRDHVLKIVQLRALIEEGRPS